MFFLLNFHPHFAIENIIMQSVPFHINAEKHVKEVTWNFIGIHRLRSNVYQTLCFFILVKICFTLCRQKESLQREIFWMGENFKFSIRHALKFFKKSLSSFFFKNS